MARTSESARNSRVRYWPDLQFWYNLTFTDLCTMPNNIRHVYERALPRLKAEQQSMMIDAAAFPNMKESAQKKLLDRISADLKKGLPKETTQRVQRPIDEPPEEEKKPASTSELAEFGIGMTFVDADGNDITDEVENVDGRPVRVSRDRL